MERGMFLEYIVWGEYSEYIVWGASINVNACAKGGCLLFRPFDLFGDQCYANPSVICPQAVEEGERNVARFRCGVVKARAQVLYISLAQLLNAAQYDNQASDHFANATEIVDRHK